MATIHAVKQRLDPLLALATLVGGSLSLILMARAALMELLEVFNVCGTSFYLFDVWALQAEVGDQLVLHRKLAVQGVELCVV